MASTMLWRNSSCLCAPNEVKPRKSRSKSPTLYSWVVARHLARRIDGQLRQRIRFATWPLTRLPEVIFLSKYALWIKIAKSL